MKFAAGDGPIALRTQNLNMATNIADPAAGNGVSRVRPPAELI